jgi:hypothetical protein
MVIDIDTTLKNVAVPDLTSFTVIAVDISGVRWRKAFGGGGGEYLCKRAYLKHLLFEEQKFENFMTGGTSLGFQHGFFCG